MALVQDILSGFIGGVSQQPDKLMYANQAKSLINMNPDAVSGLSKRKPTVHVAKIMDKLETLPLCYTVAKENEKYEILLDGKRIRVFDLTGTEKTVNYQNSYIYSGNLVQQKTLNKINLKVKYEALGIVTVITTNNKTKKYYKYKLWNSQTYYTVKPFGGKNTGSLYSKTSNSTKEDEMYNCGSFQKNASADMVSISLKYWEGVLDNEQSQHIFWFPSYEPNNKTPEYESLLDKDLYLTTSFDSKYGTVRETSFDKETLTHTIKIGDAYAPLSYIQTSQPLKDLTVTNIGDYTFITNKTVITQLSDETYPNRYPSSALLFVEQGDYSAEYKVTVNMDGWNKSKTVSLTTSGTKKAEISTTYIASQLYNKLKAILTTPDWHLVIQNSTILIQRVDGQPFTITSSDSNSDRSLYCFKKETESFTYLPTIAPDGYIIKITGESGDTSDDYYVQFHTADNTSFGSGTWKECCSPEMKYHILPHTMPHALVREADGTFTFKTIDWTDRHAGDEDTAKTPDMFGHSIQEVFTHKGRLAFLSGDKSIYSDTQDIFSFFKRTTITKLDTDPVEICSNSKMVELKHVVPYGGDLLAFSPTSIFTVGSGDVFSNSTVTIDLTMEYPCSSYCKPIPVGNTCLFVYDNGNYSGLYEVYTTSTYTTSARSITAQTQCYIPKGVVKMTAQSANNIVCLLSENERNALYVYNYYYNSEQKVQSAWHKWLFEGTIIGIDFVENYLYLTIQYDDGIYLEYIDTTPQQTELNLDFLFYLDRKFRDFNLDDDISLIYSEIDNTTTLNIPYPIQDFTNFMVIDSNGVPLNIVERTISESTTETIIKVEGKHEDITCGFTYYSEWRLGNIYYRKMTQQGTPRVVEGTLMLGDITFTYIDSGYFRVEIIPHFTSQSPTIQEYTGVVLGCSSALLGTAPIHSDTFLVPIMARNEDVDIIVKNDSYLPLCISSLVWIGEMCVRGQ